MGINTHTSLTLVWFGLIAVLWIGYFVLEGFDFGVGMLIPVLGKNEAERRTMYTALGPLWDGNEVWVLVAGGATFAAFPEWYATLFSGFYLPLLLILVALILRGVAMEYRSKYGNSTWRKSWDSAMFIGSFLPALLWGVAFANIVRGVPLKADSLGHVQYVGGFFNLLNPYALLGGLVTLTLFLTHGAIFVSLKTDGELRTRANALSGKIGLVAAVLAVAFLLWSQLSYSSHAWTWIPVLLAALFWVGSIAMNFLKREGWAFLLSSATLTMAVTALFGMLYPNVLPNIDRAGIGLTVHTASSTPYTLKVMTIVAIVFTPIVLAYQAWSYWVFHRRLSANLIPNPERGVLDEVHAS
jgi:cytochrome d ubiquinol oxidase subunit II